MNCRNKKEIYKADIKNKGKVIFFTSKVLFCNNVFKRSCIFPQKSLPIFTLNELLSELADLYIWLLSFILFVHAKVFSFKRSSNTT